MSTILVADDDPFSLRLLEQVCSAGGYRVLTAHDGESALDVASRRRPDLLLLDLEMPKLGGAEVIRVLARDPEFGSLPVLIIVDRDRAETAQEALDAGAIDTLMRPFQTIEVHQRIRNALRLRDAELRASIPPALGIVDPATRVGTRQELLITLEYEFSRAVRYRRSLTLLAVRFGDAWHASGAESGAIKACLRNVDQVFRSGAPSFVALLPETDAEGAEHVRSRLAKAFPAAADSPTPHIAAATYPSTSVDSSSSLLEAVERATVLKG